MYKIKSNVGEVRELCKAYLKQWKRTVKNRRVRYIHEHIQDKNLFCKKKYKSVKDVVRYMKNTRQNTILDISIWDYKEIGGSAWMYNVKELFENISNLPDDREIWLQEEMSFLFTYKENQ